MMSMVWVDVLCICWSQDGKMAADWAIMGGYYELAEMLWVKFVHNIIANCWHFHLQHMRGTIRHWGGPQANHVSSSTSHCRTHSEMCIFCKSALYWCVIHWHIFDIAWRQSCKVEWAPTKLFQISKKWLWKISNTYCIVCCSNGARGDYGTCIAQINVMLWIASTFTIWWSATIGADWPIGDNSAGESEEIEKMSWRAPPWSILLCSRVNSAQSLLFWLMAFGNLIILLLDWIKSEVIGMLFIIKNKNTSMAASTEHPYLQKT